MVWYFEQCRVGLNLVGGRASNDPGSRSGYAYIPVEEVLVANNTFRNVGTAVHTGLWRDDDSKNNRFVNNLFHADSDAKVLDFSGGTGRHRWEANLIYQAGSGTLGIAPGAGVRRADPRFAGPGSLYRLSAQSPAIGAGATLPGVATDVEGKRRAAMDIFALCQSSVAGGGCASLQMVVTQHNSNRPYYRASRQSNRCLLPKGLGAIAAQCSSPGFSVSCGRVVRRSVLEHFPASRPGSGPGRRLGQQRGSTDECPRRADQCRGCGRGPCT
jgi:hypothetical protein